MTTTVSKVKCRGMEHWWNDPDRGNGWVWSTGGMILTGEMDGYGALVEWSWQGKWNSQRNHVAVPLCPPQILRGLTWNRTRTSTVRRWWLIDWAIAHFGSDWTTFSLHKTEDVRRDMKNIQLVSEHARRSWGAHVMEVDRTCVGNEDSRTSLFGNKTILPNTTEHHCSVTTKYYQTQQNITVR
jgi:hypothetical protein